MPLTFKSLFIIFFWVKSLFLKLIASIKIKPLKEYGKGKINKILLIHNTKYPQKFIKCHQS